MNAFAYMDTYIYKNRWFPQRIVKCLNVPRVVQISNFLAFYPNGLLYQIMHKIIISFPIALIFGRLVPG